MLLTQLGGGPEEEESLLGSGHFRSKSNMAASAPGVPTLSVDPTALQVRVLYVLLFVHV